jgi:hypothetical protein
MSGRSTRSGAGFPLATTRESLPDAAIPGHLVVGNGNASAREIRPPHGSEPCPCARLRTPCTAESQTYPSEGRRALSPHPTCLHALPQCVRDRKHLTLRLSSCLCPGLFPQVPVQRGRFLLSEGGGADPSWSGTEPLCCPFPLLQLNRCRQTGGRRGASEPESPTLSGRRCLCGGSRGGNTERDREHTAELCIIGAILTVEGCKSHGSVHCWEIGCPKACITFFLAQKGEEHARE